MKNIRWMSILAAIMLPITALAATPTFTPMVSFVTPEPESSYLYWEPTPTFTPMVPFLTPEPETSYLYAEPTPTPTPALELLPVQETIVPGLPVVSTSNTLEENVVVLLPTLAPAVSLQIVEMENEYVIDLEAYYGGEYAVPVTSYQMPTLTPEEIERAIQAKARYDAGERPSHHILNPIENVVIGVYEMPAEQYQGEAAFVILPQRELTDEELLQLVDAFATLGGEFDPNGLNWRNCMRGGSIECTRGFAGDEAERFGSLQDLCRRGLIKPVGSMTALPCDDGFGVVPLNPDEFCGMTEFRFFPARRLTDEELLQYGATMLNGQQATAEEYSEWEARLRQQLYNIMGTPLSAKRIRERLSVERDNAIWGEERKLYRAQFELLGQGGIGNHEGAILTESGDLANATIFCQELMYSDVRCDPFDVKWQDIAVKWVNDHRNDGVNVVQAWCFGEDYLQDSGYGAIIEVTMENGGVYSIRIHYGTEQVFDVEYSDAVRKANEDAFWMSYISDLENYMEGGN